MTENEIKRKTLELLLPRCPYLVISQFDTTSVFPESIMESETYVVIRFGRTKGVMDMPDLVLDEWGFRVTISIGGRHHQIRAAWESVLQLYTENSKGDADCVIGWSRWIGLQHGKAEEQRTKQPAAQPQGLRLVKND